MDKLKIEMDIINIVVHHVKREENETPKLKLSEHLLDKTNSTVTDFVKRLIKSFASKNPTYGTFEENSETFPFQKFIGDYLNNDFLKFSYDSMDILKKEIKVPQAKGGYVVFIHYTENQNAFLIVAMLDKSAEFTVDDSSMDIKKLKTLSIDKLARASRININKWEDNADTYLAFIKGTRIISSYFQKFIGSTDLTSSKENLENLKNAMSKFMRDNKYDDDKKDSVNQSINEYLETQRKEESDVELATISAHINPENPNSFIEFIQKNEEIEVSGSFRISKKSDLYMFHRVNFKGTGFKLEFEKELIKNGKIIRDENDIIIKDMPQDILDKEFDNYKQ